jgi:release factor glutamine methyltransferase
MSPTLKDLLDEGCRQLQDAGIANPRLAVEVMLRFLLELRRVDLYLKEAMPVPLNAERKFHLMVERKLRREPLQYVIGETEWFGLKIKCDSSALVPRPETEIIVERALELIADLKEPLVADIGTGSGNIAIAIALSRTDAQVVATDISQDALLLAGENVACHGVEARVALRQGNLFEPLGFGAVFDLIISNPPYVLESEFPSLMPEVRDYEPQIALVAGEDGLSVIRPLISDAHLCLKSGGLLVLEIGEHQAADVRRLVAECEMYDLLTTIIDYNDKCRGIIVRRR